jgi:hypothetical protein
LIRVERVFGPGLRAISVMRRALPMVISGAAWKRNSPSRQLSFSVPV